jgi:glycine reductase
MACAEISRLVAKELGIPVVTGMYTENPGVEVCREFAYIASSGSSAADMGKTLPVMAGLAKKLLAGEEIGAPEENGYIPRGCRKTLIVEKRGSLRAVDMLLAVLAGRDFKTEMPMPVFDSVPPAPAIKDLSRAVIALCTSGGLVPQGNPDRVESAAAQKWAKYDISGRKALSGYAIHDAATKTFVNDFYSTHGGYDPAYANEMPDRIAPLDILNEFRDEAYIGGIFKFFCTTTGTGTAVSKAKEFGREIGAMLKEAGVDGVILTST